MARHRRWQFLLIAAAIFLTLYNTLPTIFYYSRSLNQPIEAADAKEVAKEIIDRVNLLETSTVSWLTAQSKNLALKPTEISINKDIPGIAKILFPDSKQAKIMASYLNQSSSLIPFPPAQLSLYSTPKNPNTTVLARRKINTRFDPKKLPSYFSFVPKKDKKGNINEQYRDLIKNRALTLTLGFVGTSEPGHIISSIINGSASNEEVLRLLGSILSYETAIGTDHPVTRRYFASFTQSSLSVSRNRAIDLFIAEIEGMQQNFAQILDNLKKEKEDLAAQDKFLDSTKLGELEAIEGKQALLTKALNIIQSNQSIFRKGLDPLDIENISTTKKSDSKLLSEQKEETFTVGKRNPFVDYVSLNLDQDTINIVLHKDFLLLRNSLEKTESGVIQKDKVNQLLFNEIGRVSRQASESVTPTPSGFSIALNVLTNSTGLLKLDLLTVAKEWGSNYVQLLKSLWQPDEGEFSPSNYPIIPCATIDELPDPAQRLGLFICYPSLGKSKNLRGFSQRSAYVIAGGLKALLTKYEKLPDSPEKRAFQTDVQNLHSLMRQEGFISHSESLLNPVNSFKNDLVFELPDCFAYLLAATRENFTMKGHNQYAILEFTDKAQRLLTKNKIETSQHEDLIKWKDEYEQAKVSLNPKSKYQVPPPTQNVFINNLKLSFLKYFRGDERKVLKWGLDLSGGKTLRVGLQDQNGSAVTNQNDLKQAANELFRRVNRLGLSEVALRIEGHNLVLDFPGSQNLSASDLIQASSMRFHVVNEQFSSQNPMLGAASETFLEGVWNEALITHRTDFASLNQIAREHLGENPNNPTEFQPLSSHAKLLYDHGLRLANQNSPPPSKIFDDSLSCIALRKDFDEQSDNLMAKSHPLMIVFRNYALEGVNLENIQTGYDSAEGNTLFFGVRSSSSEFGKDGGNPREDFYNWTSEFAEENIIGTPKAAFSGNKGWRMAVILNDAIVSSPSLKSPLRESARINGHFSQREVNQLASDLKAGSLSFTPIILAEDNVSPDLSQVQRNHGISAALLGLFLVFATMIIYYRFGGIVACIAVLLNLFIIWGVLQNLSATLTLPGIAGIILAIGMSVDANVLVFERIREEFALCHRLPTAITAGYRKAFSAIVDSNLTTIIAAIILLNFDSGPIKGFALTLIIGIVSSLFTTLFATKFFFNGWVKNPKHKALSMCSFFKNIRINFLKHTKPAFITSAIIILVGLALLAKEGSRIFGMDFTGGYALTVSLNTIEGQQDYRSKAKKALEQAGTAAGSIHIQELNKPNQLRIQIGTQAQEINTLPSSTTSQGLPQHPLFLYQNYPAIVHIQTALEQEGLTLAPDSLADLHLHWTEMSGQLSETMRNQAIFGLCLALICILIYITFRFEWAYAVSATMALIHDLLVVLGIIAVLHLWLPIQIDLQAIAALMTIIGYSLNDTIIIFDRIREDLQQMRKQSFKDIVNHALNATLSRTLMTSITTFVVVLPLVLFGEGPVFNFALIMSIGIIIGTFSSLYIATPLLTYFQKNQKDKKVVPTKHA